MASTSGMCGPQTWKMIVHLDSPNLVWMAKEQNLNLYPNHMWFKRLHIWAGPKWFALFQEISFLTIVIYSDKVQPKSTFDRLMNEAGKPGKKAANPEKQEAQKK